MAEQEKREPYEQPELVKLGSLKELTGWEFTGSCDPWVGPCDP